MATNGCYWTLDKARIFANNLSESWKEQRKRSKKPTFRRFSASFIALESFREDQTGFVQSPSC
jgi:hypothetical protein